MTSPDLYRLAWLAAVATRRALIVPDDVRGWLLTEGYAAPHPTRPALVERTHAAREWWWSRLPERRGLYAQAADEVVAARRRGLEIDALELPRGRPVLWEVA